MRSSSKPPGRFMRARPIPDPAPLAVAGAALTLAAWTTAPPATRPQQVWHLLSDDGGAHDDVDGVPALGALGDERDRPWLVDVEAARPDAPL